MYVARLQTATNINGNWSRDRIRVIAKQSTHEKLIVPFANNKFTKSKWSTEFTWIGLRCRFGTWWSYTRKSQFEKGRLDVTAKYANWKCEYDASCHGQWERSEWRFHALSSGGPFYGHHAISAITNRCSATVSLHFLLTLQSSNNLNRNFRELIQNHIAQRISDASEKRSGNPVAKVSRRCGSGNGGHAIGWWCYAFDICASAVATILNEIGILAISSAGRFQFGGSQSLRHFPATTTAYQTFFGSTILRYRLFIDNHTVRWRSKWIEWQWR